MFVVPKWPRGLAGGKEIALKRIFRSFYGVMPLAILWLLPIGCQVAPPIGSSIEDQNLTDGVYEGYFQMNAAQKAIEKAYQ